jgi:hypothetical protein
MEALTERRSMASLPGRGLRLGPGSRVRMDGVAVIALAVRAAAEDIRCVPRRLVSRQPTQAHSRASGASQGFGGHRQEACA